MGGVWISSNLIKLLRQQYLRQKRNMKDLLLEFGNFFLASRRERLSHLLNSQNNEYKINILWFYHLHWVFIWLILIVFFRFWRFIWITRDEKMRGVTAMDITLLEEFKFRWMGTQGNHCYCTTMQSLQNFQGQLLLLRHHAIPADINYFYKYSTTIFIQKITTIPHLHLLQLLLHFSYQERLLKQLLLLQQNHSRLRYDNSHTFFFVL